MHCEHNCLMTGQTKKLRAYIPPECKDDEWDMWVLCNEVGPTNFGETFPRLMGKGVFDEKGIFSIAFCQQTTSNNKKKGAPTLSFAIEFK